MWARARAPLTVDLPGVTTNGTFYLEIATDHERSLPPTDDVRERQVERLTRDIRAQLDLPEDVARELSGNWVRSYWERPRDRG